MKATVKPPETVKNDQSVTATVHNVSQLFLFRRISGWILFFHETVNLFCLNIYRYDLF